MVRDTTENEMLTKFIRGAMLVSVVLGVGVLSMGCGKDAEEVCADFCAKFEECSPGLTCTCNTKKDDGSECGNEQEILDHIDSCSGVTCGNFTSCLTKTPACQ
jgi:hypothetical protein